MEDNVSKKQLLSLLNDEFNLWDERLANLSEEQIGASSLPNGWTVKDLMAHLMAWEQLTIARLEAARLNKEPMTPEWVKGVNLDLEETLKLKHLNAQIDDLYKDESWEIIYQGWKTNFLNVLALAEETPETALLEKEKYPWLKGYSLMTNLTGVYEHHHEDHMPAFLAWFKR